MIEDNIILISIIGAGLIIIIQHIYYSSKIRAIKKEIKELKSSLKSGEVRFGKSWENFLPFMREYKKKHDPINFRFIGSPIDGISFDENEVVFIEIKTGKSKLSQRQRNIKKQIEQKKIRWEEYREKDLS